MCFENEYAYAVSFVCLFVVCKWKWLFGTHAHTKFTAERLTKIIVALNEEREKWMDISYLLASLSQPHLHLSLRRTKDLGKFIKLSFSFHFRSFAREFVLVLFRLLPDRVCPRCLTNHMYPRISDSVPE